MKAIIWGKYGGPDVLKLGVIDKPVPKDNEILVKIHATTVSAGDCEMRELKFSFIFKILIRILFGFLKPKDKILGQELAGEVESMGKNVTRFKVGDRVFASTGMKLGAYAQYICIAENPIDTALAIMPRNMSFEQATSIPIGGMAALHFLKIASVEAGDRVLINGAGGSIGTIAIQLAKYYGAEVTAVDRTEKLDILLSAGADYVIDYKKEDFTSQSKTYDIIFDVI
ncbi:MAG: NAD(P)-dependent alcohol dehydrogenase, partial [Acidaminobacteraceae bacterium]